DELARIDANIFARRQIDRHGIRQRHHDGEMRALPEFRLDLDFTAEHARHAFHDRQAEAKSARDAGTLIEPEEFDEDLALLGLRNADAGIVDVDPQMLAAPPATDQ